MAIYHLRIGQAKYRKLISFEKKFEITKDLNYQVGDIVDFEELVDNRFTGFSNTYRIDYVARDENCGLKKGYCVLSLSPYYL